MCGRTCFPLETGREYVNYSGCMSMSACCSTPRATGAGLPRLIPIQPNCRMRSEEHTSELQSRLHLVCRLLLEKKKNNIRSLMRSAECKRTVNFYSSSARDKHKLITSPRPG